MTTQCPKCKAENPVDSKFCKECGTQLIASEGQEVSYTKTLLTPVEDLTKGTLFAGRYEIIEELGKGGMGKVYKALDNEIHEEVAIKLLKPEIAADEKIIERFRNELKIARKITHKNVCRTYHIGKEDGTPYITMEFVPGEDLKGLIKKEEKLSKENALDIAKQVCLGLSEAHELGVVHRDLKPQNIMIDDSGSAKIMDFGIARSVEAEGVTEAGMIIGTPDYISPEQAEGEEADRRSDIYSLGVILYEMVTGTVPFKGDTAISVAIKHKSQLPLNPRKFNPDISDDLSRLILICMEKARERRYQTAEELLADLRNIEEGLPLGTKIRPRRETFIQTLIRKKLIIPALVVVLAIVAIMIWQFLPTKEVSTFASERPSLAIMYFKNNTGDENLDYYRETLSDMIVDDLAQSKHIYVLEKETRHRILQKLDLLGAQNYSDKDLRQVADQGVARYIMTGNYIKAGDMLRINITLLEGQTGKRLGSERVEGKEQDIFSMVDELTGRVKNHFNLTDEQLATDINEEIGKITTSSPEAYKFFSQSAKPFYEGNWRECIQLSEKALEIDPEFAMANLMMGFCNRYMGYRTKEIECKKKAFELRERVSTRERYQIEGTYYALSKTTYDKAIESFKKLLEFYPEDVLGNTVLGSIYMRSEELDKAIERLEVLRRIKTTNFRPYTNLASAYNRKGMYEKAVEVLSDYLKEIADSPTVRNYLAIAYALQKKYDLALAEVNKVLEKDPFNHDSIWIKGDIFLGKEDWVNAEREYQKLLALEEPAARDDGVKCLAFLYVAQGRFEDAEKQYRQGLLLATEIEEKTWEYWYHTELTHLYLRSGKVESALGESEKMFNFALQSKDPSLRITALYYKGMSYVKMRAFNEALKISEELNGIVENEKRPEHLRLYHILQGKIELERGNYPIAIEYFQKVLSTAPVPYSLSSRQNRYIDFLAGANYRAGQIEKAQEGYEKIIAVPQPASGDIYAKAFYMLGKIYEQKGWKGKAIEHYEKFLELWKDADPGIAEVGDARERLAGLRNQ